MKKILRKSPAKINLTLEVVKKLSSGFHEIRSIMIKLDNLYDSLEIVLDENFQGIKIICQDKKVPVGRDNTIWKIAEAFFEKTGKRIGLKVKIKKNIPLCSGMGGGSSNAASVLLALNDYFKNSLAKKQLIELASEIGKDIPFFLGKEQAAYVRGAGEKISLIRNFPKLNLLIVKPPGEISTPWAYGELDKKTFFMEKRGRKNISLKLIKNLKNKKFSADFFYNDFEMVAKEKYPVIEILQKFFLSFGATGVSLSGKGPTVFGIFKNKRELKKAEFIIRRQFRDFFIAIE